MSTSDLCKVIATILAVSNNNKPIQLNSFCQRIILDNVDPHKLQWFAKCISCGLLSLSGIVWNLSGICEADTGHKTPVDR